MLVNTFAIALFSTFAVWLATFAYGMEVHKQLHFDLRELFFDFVMVIISCLVMSVAIWFVGRLVSTLILKILLEVLTGGCVYILLTFLFNSKYFNECFDTIKNVTKKIHRRN